MPKANRKNSVFFDMEKINLKNVGFFLSGWNGGRLVVTRDSLREWSGGYRIGGGM